jgi:hypothetical protein
MGAVAHDGQTVARRSWKEGLAFLWLAVELSARGDVGVFARIDSALEPALASGRRAQQMRQATCKLGHPCSASRWFGGVLQSPRQSES